MKWHATYKSISLKKLALKRVRKVWKCAIAFSKTQRLGICLHCADADLQGKGAVKWRWRESSRVCKQKHKVHAD